MRLRVSRGRIDLSLPAFPTPAIEAARDRSATRRAASFLRKARWAAALSVLWLGACTAPDAHVPPFARVPYQTLSRQAVVAIALREWRLFGSHVGEDGGTDRPERDPGLWQRVGEYWWLGLDACSPESGWTGKHDGSGRVFPETSDWRYAWSAAFISYVMRIAGAGDRFPYAPDHATYINAARINAARVSTGRGGGRWAVVAERPETYAPVPGDLVCRGRSWATGLRFDDLPADPFPSHCDIVVGRPGGGTIAVVGGNVVNAVTLRHLPVTSDGRLVAEETPWLAVLRLSGASDPAPALLLSHVNAVTPGNPMLRPVP